MATHVLKNTNTILDVTFSAGESSVLPTVLITDDQGAAVAHGTVAHDASVPTPIVGRYTCVLPPQTELGVLTVDWTGTFGGVVQTVRTYADVVGSRLFTVAELRAHQDAISDPDDFPDWKIAVARDRIEDFFRDGAGVSFTKRRRRVQARARGGQRLAIPDTKVSKVNACSIAGSAMSSTELAGLDLSAPGEIIRSTPWGSPLESTPVDLTYEYGYDDAPAQIRYAAMMIARREVVTIDVDDRAVSLANDLGTVRLSVPTPGGVFRTGIPIVDQALDMYSWTELLV